MNELIEAIRRIIPHCQFESDNDGQIIIYTNLKLNDRGELEKMED